MVAEGREKKVESHKPTTLVSFFLFAWFYFFFFFFSYLALVVSGVQAQTCHSMRWRAKDSLYLSAALVRGLFAVGLRTWRKSLVSASHLAVEDKADR